VPVMATSSEDARHAKAVRALQASYAGVPAGSPVRLAKRTSNLFRPRAAHGVTGLDVSGLDGVIRVDAQARTADVQGMCTYERLVEATLAAGMMPLVVPQLKSITLGGAVSGLGIESTSFRNGLPHESVRELDVLTGDGRVVTASPDQHPDLFAAFPNSYGSLGYAVRLRIELEAVHPYVALRHVRFGSVPELITELTDICRSAQYENRPVDFVDGVMFAPDEAYLSLGRWCDTPADAGLMRVSDYTGQAVYYRSIRERSVDLLTVRDYLWRWDTDWFWCSRALGVEHPVVRRAWPARYRRSDVYSRIVGLENRYGVMARIDRLRGRPARERVVQDVEIPIEGTADFLVWLFENVGMSPVWLCPLRLREPAGPGTAAKWPLYPLRPCQLYVNVGFWGTVPITGGRADGDVNREVESAVARYAGHKSLYADSYYDEATFDAIYGGGTYREVKAAYDPERRLTDLYDKAVGRR
jgi:FAD/FMN-containing dehydrogenase